MLRLLALLQGRRQWTGTELAQRLEVAERTVRRDVERLRDLGYAVKATRGPEGGYRLAPSGLIPPLLLDDEESIAIAVSLGTAARASVGGISESALRALAKLERVMPPQLRATVTALADTTVTVPATASAADIPGELISVLASAARDHQVIRFEYTDRDGRESLRRVEPYRLVAWDRRWYLLAWDLDRRDWRRFRLDRAGRVRTPAGPRFSPRALPANVAASVAREVAAAGYRARARVVVHAPAALVAARVPGVVGPIEALGADRCVLDTGADSYRALAAYLGMLGADFDVEGPPELIDAIRELSERYARAVP